MPYGEIRVDTITFTNGGVDTSITVSGLAASTTGNLTVTGTISGAIVRATTVSGVTVTGTTVQGASGTFTSITGGIATITSGVFALGSAAAPSISFSSDPNTGIYSPGGDQVAITTSGTGRLFVTSAGLVGIGTSAPGAPLHVEGQARVRGGDTGDSVIKVGVDATGNRASYVDLIGDTTYTTYGLRVVRNGGANGTSQLLHRGTGDYQITAQEAGSIAFLTSNTERARIDSSGRLLVGTSTARANFNNSTITARLQVEGNTYGTSSISIVSNGVGATDTLPTLKLARSGGSTVGSNTAVGQNFLLGGIEFLGSDGTEFVSSASIEAFTDATPGANDMPGRLVFSTTADGASSPTERLRITSAGLVGIGTSAPEHVLQINRGSGSNAYISLTGNGGTMSSSGILLGQDATGVSRLYQYGANPITFWTNDSERFRCDSSGRLLVGTSSISTNNAIFAVQGRSDSSTAGGALLIAKGTGDPVDGGALGEIRFTGNNYVVSAQINVNRDGGTWTAGSSHPSRIAFATTADGASSPTERMRITSAGLVGIGTSAPSTLLHAAGAVRVGANDATDAVLEIGAGATGNRNAYIDLTGDTTYTDFGTRLQRENTGANADSALVHRGTGSLRIEATDAGNIAFRIQGSERLRCDSSGRLLVGTSTARANFYNGTDTGIFQVEGANDITKRFSSFIYGRDNADGPLLLLGKHRGTSVGGTTVVASGDEIGRITFQGSDGTQFVAGAEIQAYVDGTPGADDMPGRLVFATTADGASSPTERVRITSGGYFKASNSGAYTSATGTYHEFYQTANAITLWTRNTEANLSTTVYYATAARAANSAFQFFVATSSYGGTADDEFNLRGDGNGYCDGSWTGGGADYAEYFEWSDGNPDADDRRGISVVLDGDKIREALPGEDPIGVISGNPSIVGDAAWNKWSGKYLRDEFGTYILEDYKVTDEDGNTVTQQRRKLNPAYDPDAEYIPREQRPEWDCVGLMGKLRIRKGQITGSRWIKMRDINNSVEEWLVR